MKSFPRAPMHRTLLLAAPLACAVPWGHRLAESSLTEVPTQLQAQVSSFAVSLSQSWLLIAAPRDHYKRSNKHRRHGKGHRPRTRLSGFQFCLPFTLCMTLASHLNFFGFCSLICKMRIIIMPRSHRLVMAGRLDTCELFTIVPGTWQRLDTLVIIVLFIIITSVSAFNL